jgi:uracil-DNA glycosylase
VASQVPPAPRYDKAAARALGREEVLREIARVNPRVVVALGDVVAATLFDDPEARVRELRGRERSMGGRPCVVSYHPLAARRRPNLYPLVVEDLRRAHDALFAGEPAVERRSRWRLGGRATAGALTARRAGNSRG